MTGHDHEPPRWFVAMVRCRGVTGPVGFALMIVGVAVAALAPPELVPGPVRLGVPIAGVVLMCLTLFLSVLPLDPVGPAAPPRILRVPVDGEWEGCNSPVDGVPSHGTHGYGQTYAIDLVPRDEDRSRPTGQRGGSFRRPETVPGFGKPVRAPSEGTVLAVHDRSRDHRVRQGRLGHAVLAVESMARELAGRRALLGNHIVLACAGSDTYVVLAHLRRGSTTVRVGDRVQPGQLLGHCGNSGNTTTPHLHIQLMEHPRASVAAGLRFVFDEFDSRGERRHAALPANGELMRAVPTSESR
ncbi:M23 family metallopeptidase [Halostreptopolyspora alba]|uniref:M23 family metallopeptidase n=2 Tax=Halostreptopolyspora alba TaxID=2487137 RepID=A0A3N0E5Q8_9ACTN|nr:M23 family metallopeptidase [Nocardiopsaceae bacterium YIM 96095]